LCSILHYFVPQGDRLWELDFAYNILTSVLKISG
jgi:hypothetical protein